MSEPNGPKQPEAGHEGNPAPLEFGDRVAHLKAGYENSQSVVRFLDTKASAVIGVIPLVIGALTGLFGVAKDWGRWEKGLSSECAGFLWTLLSLTVIVAVVLLWHAVFAILSAFNAILPRDTGEAKPSVLFPFEKKYRAPAPDDSFAGRVTFFKEAAKRADVLEDYNRQLVRMGQITSEKLTCVNDAVKHLRWFFIVAVVLIGIFLGSTLVSALVSLK